MSPSLQLLCHTLIMVTLVQASLIHVDHFEPKKAFVSPRDLNLTLGVNATRKLDADQGLNATRKKKTPTAGSRAALASPAISSNVSLVSPLQTVQPNVSTPSIVKTCGAGTNQGCTCSVQKLAAQAIDDAVTMVQAVMKVWSSPNYQTILQQYMGSSCQTTTAFERITQTLANLANIKEYGWLPYVTDTQWSSDYSGNLLVYCAAGFPPRESSFTAQCQDQFSMGWAYSVQTDQTLSSFIGFCDNPGFVSRSTMLGQLRNGSMTLQDQRLGNNYGRAALSVLVQLSPYINKNTQGSSYGYGAQLYGYKDVFRIASKPGCDASHPTPLSSLSNADNWALWISTLYFVIEMTSPSIPRGPVISSDCDGSSACFLTTPLDCVTAVGRYDDNAIYTQYASHWVSDKWSMGCTAIFTCTAGYPAGGISGADIKKYFGEIYVPKVNGGAGCGQKRNTINHPCGSVYLSNGCRFKFDECDKDIGHCKTCNGTSCTAP